MGGGGRRGEWKIHQMRGKRKYRGKRDNRKKQRSMGKQQIKEDFFVFEMHIYIL
jgi:hypothetical protein